MRLTSLLFLMALVLAPLAVQAQLPLFSSDSLIEVKLEGDLFSTIRDRSEDPEYQLMTLTLYQSGGDSMQLPVKAKVRGNFRRRKSTCQFPPLRLKFADEDVEGTLFEGQGKLKLVTHCRGRNQAFEQKLFQEYLAYRSYNLITDQSFRVRLIKITYVNTGKRPYVEEHHAFLIEDDDDLAARMGGTKMETGRVHPMMADPISANRVALFQFMLGNTDWSIPNQHNLELIITEPGTLPKIVPYDFDWSGIVGAPYAEPNPVLGLTSVKQRLFRGFCRPEETWTPVWEEFNSSKDEIIELYTNFPLLEDGERKEAINYIEDFYEIINDPRKKEIAIDQVCRTDR